MPFSVQRRIEFRDTDAAGIAHFSVFFPMMEAAEHELLRSLGIAVLPQPDEDQSSLTWPRVAASCDYVAAAHFQDVLNITVRVAHIGTSSVQYEFHFTRDDQPIAEGRITVVCCRLSGAGLMKAEIPDLVRQQLTKHQ